MLGSGARADGEVGGVGGAAGVWCVTQAAATAAATPAPTTTAQGTEGRQQSIAISTGATRPSLTSRAMEAPSSGLLGG